MNRADIAWRRAAAFVTVVLVVGGARLVAGEPEWYFRSGDAALSGYDAVAYFTESRAVKGDAKFETSWNGARWRFSSAENRDRFANAPAKYAPQFGGYCAYAVSDGHTASGDPKAWSVVNGRLYINYSPSVRQEWEKDRTRHIARAEANWPEVLGK
jgi:YHS domain-containing protein